MQDPLLFLWQCVSAGGTILSVVLVMLGEASPAMSATILVGTLDLAVGMSGEAVLVLLAAALLWHRSRVADRGGGGGGRDDEDDEPELR